MTTIDPQLADRIRQAIASPAQVLPRAASRETARAWSARAVLAVLEAWNQEMAEEEQARVEELLRETGLLGMEPTDDGFVIRLKHAQEIATAMVEAFDAMCSGATNYVEQESTVTDPARERAVLAGLPLDQIPPPRTYRIIIVKPGGRTPHELRRAAEEERDRLRAELDAHRHDLSATLAALFEPADLHHLHQELVGRYVATDTAGDPYMVDGSPAAVGPLIDALDTAEYLARATSGGPR
jgi:hypothetical protein